MLLQVSCGPSEQPCVLCGSPEGRIWTVCEDSEGLFAASPPICFECFGRYKINIEATPLQTPLLRSNPKRLRKSVARQEKDLADLFGGHPQKASGATRWAKGDSRLPFKYLGEAKQTSKNSYTLKRSVLDKLRAECAPGEIPVVSIRFTNPQLGKEDEWILLPADKIHKLT